MSQQQIDLYSLLPSAYRIDDAAQGYPLLALMNLLSEQANLVRQNVDDLWDDFFIETCAEWVIPYIGDLVGNIPIYDAVRGRRGDVARTIYFRRRKGTVPMLEELARSVIGWSVHAVEFFQLLAWTQNLNHLRPEVKTVDLRNLDTLDLVQTAFDPFSHTVDVRPTSFNHGWHNIKKIGFFIWRLESYQLNRVMPRRALQDIHDYGFHFSPLGHMQPLFNPAQSETIESEVASEIHVNGPIRPTAFHFHHEQYYQPALGSTIAPPGISIYLDRTQPASEPFLDAADVADQEGELMRRVPPEKIICKNLHAWQAPLAGEVAIDVARGRFTFGVSQGGAAPNPNTVRVNYAYGFSADIGGGPYDRDSQREQETVGRPLLFGNLEQVTPDAHNTLQAALDHWNANELESLVIEISDSRTYDGNLVIDKTDATHDPGATLVIQAKNEARPTISGTIRLGKRAPATVILNGLLIEGSIDVLAAGNTASLQLYHCTLVPGLSLDEAGEPQSPLAPSLVVADDNHKLSLSLNQSISGPLLISSSLINVTVTDCILQAPGEAEAHLLPVLISGTLPSPLTLPASPSLHIRIGNHERQVTLASSPTTPADARAALEAAIRATAPEQPAFAMTQVLLTDERLVIVPGKAELVADPISARGLEEGDTGDDTLDQLFLNVASSDAATEAYAAYGLLGAARSGPFATKERKISLRMEEDKILAHTPATRTITIAANAQAENDLTVLAADLQLAIRAWGGHAFRRALVTTLVTAQGESLLLLPGLVGIAPMVTTAAGDVASASEMGLSSARPLLAANAAGTVSAPPLMLENVTLFGPLFVKELTEASNTIFTDTLYCERRQTGCVRFSYLAEPERSRTPRRYRCQPDTALESLGNADPQLQQRTRERLAPTFSTRQYGQPAYAQLALHTAPEIGTGADNGAEMGVFNRRMQPQRLANLRTRLAEYLPFGLEAAVIFVT